MNVLNMLTILDEEPLESLSITDDLMLLVTKRSYSIYQIEFTPDFSLENVITYDKTNQSLTGDIMIKSSKVNI